jgi:hypothetical protein
MYFRTRIRGTKWVVELKCTTAANTAGTIRYRYPFPSCALYTYIIGILYYIHV